MRSFTANDSRRRPALLTIALLVLGFARVALAIEGGAAEFAVWDGVPPGFVPVGPPRETRPTAEHRQVPLLTDVARPYVRCFPATAVGGANGSVDPARRRPAIVVVPGGGFHVLAYDHEGAAVARWLNTLGLHAFVLHYRVPTATHAPPWEPGLADLQETLRRLRGRADELRIDTEGLGVLGFSAGGHLAARATLAETVPPASRPDFAVLVYPYRIVAENDPTQLRAGMTPSDTTPPLFLVHAADDGVRIENSLTLHAAAIARGRSVEMHAFATGGHGFGMLSDTRPGAAWPSLCAGWLRGQGFAPLP